MARSISINSLFVDRRSLSVRRCALVVTVASGRTDRRRGNSHELDETVEGVKPRRARVVEVSRLNLTAARERELRLTVAKLYTYVYIIVELS